MDYISLTIVIEEIAKVCVSTAVTLMAHTSLGSGPFYLFGNEEQKNKYLSKLSTGEIIGSFALTEPNAGSDAGNTQTIAELKNNSVDTKDNLLDLITYMFTGVVLILLLENLTKLSRKF